MVQRDTLNVQKIPLKYIYLINKLLVFYKWEEDQKEEGFFFQKFCKSPNSKKWGGRTSDVQENYFSYSQRLLLWKHFLLLCIHWRLTFLPGWSIRYSENNVNAQKHRHENLQDKESKRRTDIFSSSQPPPPAYFCLPQAMC